jgi:3-methylcrotonyl-CoA carboxylase alpha subunit
VLDGWRIGGPQREILRFALGERERDVAVSYRPNGYRLHLDARAIDADAVLEADGSLNATIGGRHVNGRVLRLGGDVVVLLRGRAYTLTPFDPLEAAEHESTGARELTAPMPGKIIQVLVKPGEAVRRGQAVAILEAMKMEHTLVAPADAVIATLPWAPGDQVSEGAAIATFVA